jgi:hypothetical protein
MAVRARSAFPAFFMGLLSGVTRNPDRPELKIEDLRLKIYGIASLCLFYLNRSFDPVIQY